MIRALLGFVRDERSGTARALARETDGAMMVVGVFMAMFLVGVLYYSIGIGEAILFRERMQDAADAASFSAAVMDARAMNLIALVNLTMAGALAVLIALRAIQLLSAGGIVLAIHLGPSTLGASLSAVAPLAGIESAVLADYAREQPGVDQVILAGHRAGRALSEGMPAVAASRAALTVTTTYAPPAQAEFIWPSPQALPTEDAILPVECNRAALYVGVVVMTRFDQITLPSAIQNWLSAQASAMTSDAASTVCGGSLTPPAYSDPRVSLVDQPETAAEQACRTGTGGDPAASCTTAAAQLVSQQYNPESGQCEDSPDGASASACLSRVAQATTACDPSNPGLSNFVYRVSEQFWTVTCPPGAPDCSPANLQGPFHPTPMQYDTTITPNPHVVLRQDTPLCGVGGSISPSYGTGGTVCQPSAAQVLNSSAAATLSPGQTVNVPVSIVEAVLGCQKHEPPSTGSVAPIVTTGSDRTTQQVIAGLHLGDDAFQVRAFVVGSRDFNAEDRGVRVAHNGLGDASPVRAQLGQLRALGQLAMSQAEFYYDDGDNSRPDLWLWNMRWHARLRRFHTPTSTSGSSLQGACAGGGGGTLCNGLDTVFALPIDSLVVH